MSIFLEEAGLAYQIFPVIISKGEQFAPDLLKIALKNRIPAILDGEPEGGGEPISLRIRQPGKTLGFLLAGPISHDRASYPRLYG